MTEKALPENIQHRMNALKHIQKKHLKEAKFFDGHHREPKLVMGEVEWKEGEVEWKEESEDDVDAEVMKRFKRMAFKYKNQYSKIIKDDIPAFWLTEF
ncbi:hypothetical protein quinque_014911 [Culex quinquefasciatus]